MRAYRHTSCICAANCQPRRVRVHATFYTAIVWFRLLAEVVLARPIRTAAQTFGQARSFRESAVRWQPAIHPATRTPPSTTSTLGSNSTGRVLRTGDVRRRYRRPSCQPSRAKRASHVRVLMSLFHRPPSCALTFPLSLPQRPHHVVRTRNLPRADSGAV